MRSKEAGYEYVTAQTADGLLYGADGHDVSGKLLREHFFLESYYYMRKKEVLVGAYDILNEAPGSSTASDSERMEELTNICLANGVSLLVIDQDNYVRLRTIWTGDDQIRLMRARSKRISDGNRCR